jgi:hypothetical protein
VLKVIKNETMDAIQQKPNTKKQQRSLHRYTLISLQNASDKSLTGCSHSEMYLLNTSTCTSFKNCTRIEFTDLNFILKTWVLTNKKQKVGLTPFCCVSTSFPLVDGRLVMPWFSYVCGLSRWMWLSICSFSENHFYTLPLSSSLL